jgi:hypothetical protein
MTWVLIAGLGAIGWLSVASFFLALCRQAGRADELADAREMQDTDGIGLRAFGDRRDQSSRHRAEVAPTSRAATTAGP